MTNQQIIAIYAYRKMTIKEIAQACGHNYEAVRRVLIATGLHNTKH